MITQLQDISNQVAQDTNLTGRLRNEEIRKRMESPWQEPVDTDTISNNTLQQLDKNGSLANIYSTLLNNYKALGNTDIFNDSRGSNSLSSTSHYSSSTYSGMGIPGVVSKGVPAALGMLGYGDVAGLSKAAMSIANGDPAQGVGTLTGMMAGKVAPGLGGVVSALTSGMLGNKTSEEIGESVVNSGIGTALTMTSPILGGLYGLSQLFGWNPSKGLFGNPTMTGDYANYNFFGDPTGYKRGWESDPAATDSNETSTDSGSYANFGGLGSWSGGDGYSGGWGDSDAGE